MGYSPLTFETKSFEILLCSKFVANEMRNSRGVEACGRKLLNFIRVYGIFLRGTTKPENQSKLH
jgi:hypothetical protein